MNRVGVLAIDADGLDWGKGHEDLGVYMRALAGLGPNGALANARFELLALQLTDRALPIVVPQGAQHCWLTSLAVTYGKALRDEIDRDQRGLLAWLYRGASWMAEGVLRLTRADHVVYVNHLLFSTSLYGAWTAEDLAPALAALRRAFPKRAIVWRSLNAEDNAGLLAAMDGQGARRVVSRMVWTLADPARQWAPRTDAKADRKLVAAGGLSVEAPTDLSPENLARVIQLYEDVYLAKYSRANPAYRSDMLLAAIESGVLNLQLVRGPEGDIQAFAADHVYERMLSSPMLGHDRDRPASAGLYRVAMSLSVLRALEAGLSVNYSAGAGAFKRHRGAKPALEYMAVFDGHLPAWRRIGYGLLARVLKAMTPSLERIALR